MSHPFYELPLDILFRISSINASLLVIARLCNVALPFSIARFSRRGALQNGLLNHLTADALLHTEPHFYQLRVAKYDKTFAKTAPTSWFWSGTFGNTGKVRF
jgi:hypothetical protein